MYTRLVRERVASDNGFVGLHGDARDLSQQLARVKKLRGVDSGFKWHNIVADSERHHDFFERGVPGAFADAVDCAFDLAGAGFDGRYRVCDCESEIVMTVNRDRCSLNPAHSLADCFDDPCELARRGVADGIRDVDG